MAAFLGVTFPGKGYKGRGVLLWKRNQAEWTEAKPLISRWVGGGGSGGADGNGFRVPIRLKNTHHIILRLAKSIVSHIHLKLVHFVWMAFRMP